MTCDYVRTKLLDHQRRWLDPGEEAHLQAHLRGCAACLRADAAEALLDDLLAHRLPRHEAPAALKRRLALLACVRAAPRRLRWSWAARVAAPALAASVAIFVSGVVTGRAGRQDGGALARLATEAVGDHLRVVTSEHPLEVTAGGSHKVKPWFAGKLDFAPTVPEPEVRDLKLEGGAVGWFLDRRAAVIAYALRKHRVTLLAFRGDDLAWPGGSAPDADERRTLSLRGFHVVLWRGGGLLYALVSDVNAPELEELATTFASAT